MGNFFVLKTSRGIDSIIDLGDISSVFVTGSTNKGTRYTIIFKNGAVERDFYGHSLLDTFLKYIEAKAEKSVDRGIKLAH